jgi:hypothetical protein
MVVPVKPTQPRGRQRYLAILFCLRRSISSLNTSLWCYQLAGTHGCCLRRSCPRGGTRLENPHGILVAGEYSTWRSSLWSCRTLM